MELGGCVFILLLFIPSEALSGPCANGGTAVGDGCVCPPGHSGPRCQTPDPASACQNGGTAVGTACYCPPGFWGPRCQHPDPASACRNGATAFGTTCVCPPGFRGDACQDAEEPGSCLNGGTLEKGTCRCPPTAWGPRCECTGMVPTTAGTPGTAGGGKVLYVSDTAGTNGSVTATTARRDSTESTTDVPPARRARNVTARPLEGNATTMGSTVRVTSTERDTVVTTMEGNTMVAATERDTVATAVDRDTGAVGSVTMATTTMEGNTTTASPARRVRNATATPMESHTRATTVEGDTTAMEGDTTATPSNLVEGETTPMEDETTAMEGETTAVEGDTEATPMEGDTEATPVATMESHTTATTVESDTVTALPGHLESHSGATTRKRNTTAMGNNTRATTLEGDTRVTTMEGNTTAMPMTTMESHTRVTTVERNTTAMGNNSRATTLATDTTAMPMTALGSHTRATENNTRATTLKSDTRATTLERDTTAMPMTALGSHTRAMENNTRATTPESHTPSTLPTTLANVTSTPTQPDGTLNDVLDATETTALTSQSPHNTTEPPGTTRASRTSRATTVVTTVATICLYLPHGSSPPAIVCHNGGVANLTRCLCPPGYSGPTCETPDPNDRCAEGSTAVGDRCICPPGRAGPRCATPDPATACRHGGTAVGTECYCPPGFSGPRCEDPRTTTGPPVTPPHPMRGKATSRSTRRTTTTTVPTTRDPCQNGGRWMGTGCLCPPNVDGARCEFGATTINLTAELGPFVTMMARVTNRDFSEDMGDTSSPGHRRFAEEFSRTMDGIYRNVSGYRGINVLSLSRGSVVVNFRVRLQPPPGNASLEHRALELLTVANAAAQPRNCSPSADGLCFTATSARAARAATPELNDTELCRRHAPANFSQFYFPLRTANGLLCVTNCTLNVPGSFDCHRGFCRLTLDGPQCFCPDLPWYLSAGDRCQTHISKLGLGLGVGLGLGLTLLILLILCIVLIVRLARGRKKSPGASPLHGLTPRRLHSAAAEDTWPDGGRNSRVTGIYHVNGGGGAAQQGPYRHNTYNASSEVADPPATALAEGAAAL